MTLDELCAGLLNGLEDFDTKILPLGLYAADDLIAGKPSRPRQQEWHQALLPWLRSHKCKSSRIWPKAYCGSQYKAQIEVPESGSVELSVVRTSAIKVRKYGSGYQVDKQEKREERWQSLKLDGHISELWKHPVIGERVNARLLIFIGFDKSQSPFERDLSQLHQSLKWDEKSVVFQTRTWPDKAKRGFGVRLATWARPLYKPQAFADALAAMPNVPPIKGDEL